MSTPSRRAQLRVVAVDAEEADDSDEGDDSVRY
jgi:hypothetical protein